MPNIVGKQQEFLPEDKLRVPEGAYNDRYDDLDLEPGDDLHDEIVSRVMNRAKSSRRMIEPRLKDWNEVDDSLNVFIRPDEEEIKVKNKDHRKPISFVVPSTYAAMESILAYYASVTLVDPLYMYGPLEPGDIVKAAMLEHLIRAQSRRAKMALNHYIAHRDSLAYGFGVVAPAWVTKHKFKTRKVPQTQFSELTNEDIEIGTIEQRDRVISYEGNELTNISPRHCLPDPDKSIHDVQKMQFFGWIERTDYMSLLELERDNEEFFNVRYLKRKKDGRSKLIRTKDQTGSEDEGDRRGQNGTTHPVDVIHMIIKIIPEDWEVGDEEYPTKYIMSVAADNVVIRFKELGLDHDDFPIAVTAPEFDGYSVTPIAKLEITQPIQGALSWFINSMVANQRKVMHDMFLVDPNLVNVGDLMNPGPGKIIRLKSSAWGKGIQDAVQQLNVQDVTSGNITNAMLFMDLMQKTSGVDMMQTVRRQTSERVSASEARGDIGSVVSKMAKMVMISDLQFNYDLAYLVASHTQQFMTQQAYIDTAGRLQQIFAAEYPNQQIPVTPQDIDIEVNILMRDSTAPGSEDIASMSQFLQVAMAHPQLSQQLDIGRMFLSVARASGFKSVHEFLTAPNPVQAQVQDPAAIAGQRQQGNLITFNELQGATNGRQLV